MDRSVMLIGLIVAYTSIYVFILMAVYRCLPHLVKTVFRLNTWSGFCVAGWFVGLWIFAIGYLAL